MRKVFFFLVLNARLGHFCSAVQRIFQGVALRKMVLSSKRVMALGRFRYSATKRAFRRLKLATKVVKFTCAQLANEARQRSALRFLQRAARFSRTTHSQISKICMRKFLKTWRRRTGGSALGSAVTRVFTSCRLDFLRQAIAQIASKVFSIKERFRLLLSLVECMSQKLETSSFETMRLVFAKISEFSVFQARREKIESFLMSGHLQRTTVLRTMRRVALYRKRLQFFNILYHASLVKRAFFGIKVQVLKSRYRKVATREIIEKKMLSLMKAAVRKRSLWAVVAAGLEPLAKLESRRSLKRSTLLTLKGVAIEKKSDERLGHRVLIRMMELLIFARIGSRLELILTENRKQLAFVRIKMLFLLRG